jgi:hypothetical protein
MCRVPQNQRACKLVLERDSEVISRPNVRGPIFPEAAHRRSLVQLDPWAIGPDILDLQGTNAPKTFSIRLLHMFSGSSSGRDFRSTSGGAGYAGARTVSHSPKLAPSLGISLATRYRAAEEPLGRPTLPSRSSRNRLGHGKHHRVDFVFLKRLASSPDDQAGGTPRVFIRPQHIEGVIMRLPAAAAPRLTFPIGFAVVPGLRQSCAARGSREPKRVSRPHKTTSLQRTACRLY